MEKPKVLVMEDDFSFRSFCKRSLERSGFDVVEAINGNNLESVLRTTKFDVILSDSDLDCAEEGYVVCSEAMKKGFIDDSVLIIAMSRDSENKDYWRGIANIGCFYKKDFFENVDVGKTITQCLRNFRSGGLWREKMPKIDY